MTSTRFRIELQLALPGTADPRWRRVDADPSATVSQFLEAARAQFAHVGFDQASVWGGVVLPGDAPLRSCQLLQGDTVTLQQSSGDEDPEDRFVPLDLGESFRVLHRDGPSAGHAWPVVPGGLQLRMRADGRWVPCDAEHSQLVVRGGEQNAVRISAGRLPGGLELWSAGRRFSDEVFGPGALVEGRIRGAPVLSLEVLTTEDHTEIRNVFGLLTFRVPPRKEASPREGDGSPDERPWDLLEVERFRVPAHPSDHPPEFDLASLAVQVAPSLLMPILLLVTFGPRWQYLVFGFALAGLMAYTWRRNRDKAERAYKERRIAWRDQAETSTAQLRAHVDREGERLRARHVAMSSLTSDARWRRGLLWRRLPSHSDFLQLNLGISERRSRSRVEAGELPSETRTMWEDHFEKARLRSDLPREFDLMREHFAVVGGDADVARYFRPRITDLLLSHAPSALSVVVLGPERRVPALDWIAGTPHVESAESAWTGPRRCRGSRAARQAIAENAGIGSALKESGEHLVLICHEGARPPLAALNELLSDAEGHLHLVWLGSSWGSVPNTVVNWVDVLPDSQVLQPAGLALSATEETLETMRDALDSVRALRDDAATGRSRAALPTSVPMGSLLSVQDEDLWTESAARSLRFDFLVNEVGVLSLDMEEHGPHMLVGGMSGSGKSEFLKSLLCSAVTKYSPKELTLLLVDYKGGASLSDFTDLPHVTGSVTNLSELDVQRLIEFLNAELLRRQRILRTFGGEYRRYRERVKTSQLPRLLVVFDEFASFIGTGKGRQEAIVSLAQRGRSLGVHMVLATQSPASAVTPEIRDNVGSRFCLKTADAAASIKVLDVPDAAAIPNSAKGRLLARLSDGRLHELQSAYTEAYSIGIRRDNKPVVLAPVAVAEGRKERGRSAVLTDLNLIIKAVMRTTTPNEVA